MFQAARQVKAQHNGRGVPKDKAPRVGQETVVAVQEVDQEGKPHPQEEKPGPVRLPPEKGEEEGEEQGKLQGHRQEVEVEIGLAPKELMDKALGLENPVVPVAEG